MKKGHTRRFLNEKNAWLSIGVAEGWWALPCLQGGEVGRDFCILKGKCFQLSAQFLINFKLTMNGRRTNTGCDSWTLPAGIFGAPRTPEGNVKVNRVELCGVMSVRSFKDKKPLGLEY